VLSGVCGYCLLASANKAQSWLVWLSCERQYGLYTHCSSSMCACKPVWLASTPGVHGVDLTVAPTHGSPGVDGVKSLLLVTQPLLQDHELLAVATTQGLAVAPGWLLPAAVLSQLQLQQTHELLAGWQ
jgi:hypothetical protein